MGREHLGRSLSEAFTPEPDHRERRGCCYQLPALLVLATAAMLAGARSLYAIGQWGRLEDPAVVRAVGFRGERTPCVATLHLVFEDLDVAAFGGALRRWAQSQLGQGEEAIAIDGKGLSGIHGEQLPGMRLVAAYATRAGLVLAQSGGQGSPQASLQQCLLAGRLLSGDALYCRRVCASRFSEPRVTIWSW